MARYQIWDRMTNVITPIGEVLTPDDWMDRYPVFRLVPSTVPILSGDPVYNGGFCGELNSMKEMYVGKVDFEGMTDQEALDAIEAYEDESAARAEEARNVPSAEERTAAALEFLAMSNLPDDEIE